MGDFLFHGKLEELDPSVFELNNLEQERQNRKLILIPSESTAPLAVRDSLSSAFQNLYAEGYPDEESRWLNEEEILNYPARLSHYRRYADPRYYKGVEYADVIEALARRRCTELFATEKVPADRLYANIQPLSGAPANNAVYTALIEPGDTILGMNLLHGGHLSHGSSVNRSGKLFKVVHYNVDPVTEQIDYDQIQALATANHPKIIIAGYSSYPWVPDWEKFRKIADSIGAIFLADVSHIAGLIAAKTIPSPIGYAQVISFTTHKTLCGPRGACLLTNDAAIARKLDRAVFPGEQGGPHVHVFAALATTFKLDRSEKFVKLQRQILINCKTLTDRLTEKGFRIPFGGTNTHLANLDCKVIKGDDGTPLSGDMAARILDIAGIVLNRNTIPGDKTALFASGIRFGTPWMTQRGLDEKDMVKVADIMADLLHGMKPYSVETRQGPTVRAKIDPEILEASKISIREISEKAGIVEKTQHHSYPHFYYSDDVPQKNEKEISLLLSGDPIKQFVAYCFTSDSETLTPGNTQSTSLVLHTKTVDGYLSCKNDDQYIFTFNREDYGLVSSFLRSLSDGYTSFDSEVVKRIPGPIIVNEIEFSPKERMETRTNTKKPYYIGFSSEPAPALPAFTWTEPQEAEVKETALHETHRKLGAKMIPFAGWDMPVWYTSVVEEHLATRQSAGLFDVSHMGVFQAEGVDAVLFLDSVCANDINALAIGESCYTHFLDHEGNVIDDTLVYHRRKDTYLVVVNASNDDKDWAWLNGVRDGKVLIEPSRPWVNAFGKNVTLRNLRDPKAGKDMRVDIALQGPKSRDILLDLGCDPSTRAKVMGLKRAELCEAVIGNFDLVVSRTGYTGEKMAFELFIHPEKSVELWEKIMASGEKYGIKPCGLGARDSLRTEAGLPLYGHEMGGEKNLSVSEAGFGSYIKFYKPWFIGRTAMLEKESKRKGVVCRFRFDEKGVRMAHNNDPVVDVKGRVIGYVTSCAIDKEGFLTGQAFIELKSSEEGTRISIFQGAPKTVGKTPAELVIGDRINIPTPAMVLSRFPKL